jgi:hypothetical protein
MQNCIKCVVALHHTHKSGLLQGLTELIFLEQFTAIQLL